MVGELIVDVTGLSVDQSAGEHRRVLDGVDLAVRAGEVVGLMGPSGSGKTTLALSLLGHIRPGLAVSAGAVRVCGRDPFLEPTVTRRRVASFLGQDPAAELNPARRIGSLLVERAADAERPLDRDELRELLIDVGLPGSRQFWRRRPYQLSGGQARRAALVLAVCNRPRLLILDEPTAGLDGHTIDAVVAMIDRRPDDLAVLLISHHRDTVTRLADRVIHLHRGVVGGTPSAATPVTGPGSGHGSVVLDVRRLAAHYRGGPVIGPIGLALRAGSTTALVGPSGSGKSTIARCLTGLHRPDSGEIVLDGRPLAAVNRRRRRADRCAIALVPQDSRGSLNPYEDVGTALLRPLTGLVGLSRSAASTRVEELVRLVRLPPGCLSRRPEELSGGERQRVNLARALAAGPRVLLCDEITSALDDDTRQAVLRLVSRLRDATGLAVLMITHNADEVADYADEVVRLPPESHSTESRERRVTGMENNENSSY
jgi:peptide/nickel transport system ATP-binding protein